MDKLDIEKVVFDAVDRYKDLFENLIKYSSGYDIYLGGGALRDFVKTGSQHVNPKDLDFMFVPNSHWSKRNLPIIPRSYVLFNRDTLDVPDIRKRGVDQIVGLNVYNQYSEVQFIVYNKFLTQVEVAKDMDCNVNQIMYNIKTGQLYFTDAFVEGHTDKVIKMMHDFDTERMCERLERMKKRTGYSIEAVGDMAYALSVYNSKPKKKRSGTSSVSMID